MKIEVRRQDKNAIVGIEFQRSDAGRSFASVTCYNSGAEMNLFLAPEDLRHLRDTIQAYLDTEGQSP